jgi:hypothetical protein
MVAAPGRDVTLLLRETVADGWPCRRYLIGWPAEAHALLAQYEELRSRLSRKLDRPNQY